MSEGRGAVHTIRFLLGFPFMLIGIAFAAVGLWFVRIGAWIERGEDIAPEKPLKIPDLGDTDE